MSTSTQTVNGHTVSTPDTEQYRLLAAWRVLALQRMPYFASILFALRPVSAPGLKTMGVDDRMRLYIDFEYAAAQGNEYSAMDLLHECGHIFGEHAERSKAVGIEHHERKLSNYSSDAAINDDLRDVGMDMHDYVLPEHLGAAEHQTYEHYVAVLRGRRDAQPHQPSGGTGGSADGGQDGGGQPSGTGSQDGDESGGGESGDPGYGCGSGCGGDPLPVELGGGDLGGDATAATPAEQRAVRIATAEAVNTAAAGRGTVPAGLVRQARMVLAPPKIRWERTLAGCIKGAVSAKAGMTDPSSRRPSRRQGTSRVLRPAWISPIPTVAVVRDTSGSMGSKELADVSSEIVGIARQIGIRGRELTVIDTDATATKPRPFTGSRTVTTIVGGGGTDMRVGIAAAADLRPRPSVIVVLTDGMTPWPSVPPRGMKVVAAIVGVAAERYARQAPGWMATVVVDRE